MWEWRNIHNEKLNNLWPSPTIVRVIKIEKKEMGSTCGAYGEERGVYRVLVGKPEGKRPWGDTGLDGRIILRRIFRKWDVGVWTGLSWLRVGTGGGHL
jgi:hypothetical protein